uniref:catechol O-methyltransferase n=1 Tax=Alexandrium monilatum TaxID=311494 RepID=A0A7S4QSZ4_9DINO
MAWACSVCAFQSKEPLADALASAAIAKLSQCESKDLANIAWAYESMPFSHAPLMESIAAASIRRCRDFNAQDLANTVWAFATRQLRDGPLLAAIASSSMPLITQFCPPELASTAWSFSALLFPHGPLLTAISAAALAILPPDATAQGPPRPRVDFDQHSLASIAWSFSPLPFRDRPLLDALSASSMRTITQANSQDLANTAWAVSTLAFLDVPLFAAISSAARRKLSDFKVKEIEMTLWALSRLEGCSSAWEIGEQADASGRLGALGFGFLLSESMLRQLLSEEVSLLRSAAVSGLGLGPTAPGVAACLAALRLAAAGEALEAIAALELGPPSPPAVAGLVTSACGGRASAPGGAPFQAPRSACASGTVGGASARSAEHSGDDSGGAASGAEGLVAGPKAAVVLQYVLRRAAHGDPKSVCDAFEESSLRLLQPARQWLKIAGGSKAEVVASALRSAPVRGSVLEVGTYLGYTAVRLAASRPGGRVVTLEVDPGHAMVAQCLAAHAGLAHRIDVWTGHSQDLLHRLPAMYPHRLRFAAVFMDQCGSRFWADLEELMRLDLLQPGAVVVADNVLKPGAPLFLWRAFFGAAGRFRARAVSVPEFAMPGVEDWMAVLEYGPEGAGSPAPSAPAPEPPPAVLELEWEARRMRQRAAGPGGVDFDDWAAFSAWMRVRLGELGIRPDDEGSEA